MATQVPRPAARRALGAAALLAAAACGGGGDDAADDSDLPTTPGQRPAPAELVVLGRGAVDERYTGEVSVRAGAAPVAYTSTWASVPRRAGVIGNAIKIWDVAGDAPVLKDSLLVPGPLVNTGDVQVADGGRLLVVATEGGGGSLVTYDIAADPLRPQLVSRFTSPSVAAGVHTAEVQRVNGRLLAFLSVDPSPARLVIVDLTDPAQPREIFARAMGQPFVHDVFVRDGLLFTALWNAGLTIWDIGGGGRGGTPEAPVALGTVVTDGGSNGRAEAHNVWWYHDASGQKKYAFVGEEGPGQVGASASGDVHVVDVSDLAKPREVAFFSVPNAGPHNFSVDEGRGVLYAAYYNGGVRAIDVRGDLGACAASEKAADGRCDLALMGRELARGITTGGFVWGVERVGDAVYASDMLGGLYKLRAVVR